MRGSELREQGRGLIIIDSTGTQGDSSVTGMKQKFN